ncbi:MAG TPA: carboxypeptidase-like regulatory domain-containing protein [Terriglobales bacterium]|nr:carboxypeptidase-like regulatory domain-containing protein [Terriglobales bacterium]
MAMRSYRGIALLAFVGLACVGSLPAQSAPQKTSSKPAAATGTLLGLVTDAGGQPQSGAVVLVRAEGLRSGASSARLLTSADGLFRLTGLAPGAYYVEVGKGARVAERRRVVVQASERALLLVNLPQLLAGAQFGPPPGRANDQAFDWALRQATVWKPILRLDDGSGNGATDTGASGNATPVAGYVALTAGGGANAFDTPSLATAFRVDTSIIGGARVAITGDVGTNGAGGGGDTRLQATFSHTDPSNPSRISIAVRQLSIGGGLPDSGSLGLAAALPSLRVVSLNYADGFSLGDRLRLQYGAMVNAVSMTDTVATFDPYFRALFELGSHAQLEYRAVSAVPPIHFYRDYADMPDPTPQVSLSNTPATVGGRATQRARLERARHQEFAYTDNFDPNDTLSAAAFDEHFNRAAINGAEADGAEITNQELLPDLLNDMFLANGGNYGGWGYRINYEHKFGDDFSADLGFSDGTALAPTSDHFGQYGLDSILTNVRAHAVTAKLSGVTPLTHTRITCSYRALSRALATGLDLYDDGPGQSDGYANIYVRQPLPGHLQALVEIHNLLAQGYLPLMGSDGHTLYLVQSARSLRGGFTFSF